MSDETPSVIDGLCYVIVYHGFLNNNIHLPALVAEITTS